MRLPAERHAIRVLLVQFWTTDVRPVEESLREVGIDAAITRADFEAALCAELDAGRFDLAIFDPTTPRMSREVVQHCIHQNNREIPLVVLDDVHSLGEAVLDVFSLRRN